ncbi:MAG TPA: hypothetical protein DC000_03310 [Clostridiales bacterium]|nr:hypothetical protein [Clostridiales bacterium]
MNANDIISAITYTLGINFPSVTPYKENVKQGFKAPAFYIEEINSTSHKQLGRKYKRRYSFSIKYYTDQIEDINQELHNVSDKLCEILELMKFDKTVIKGTGMESKIDDNVLHFQIDVKVNLLKENTNSKLGALEVDVNAKS